MQLAMIKNGSVSKINWTQVIGVAASAATIFGFDLDAKTQVEIVAGIQALQATVTWFLRTFMTAKPVESDAVVDAAEKDGIPVKT